MLQRLLIFLLIPPILHWPEPMKQTVILAFLAVSPKTFQLLWITKYVSSTLAWRVKYILNMVIILSDQKQERVKENHLWRSFLLIPPCKKHVWSWVDIWGGWLSQQADHYGLMTLKTSPPQSKDGHSGAQASTPSSACPLEIRFLNSSLHQSSLCSVALTSFLPQIPPSG